MKSKFFVFIIMIMFLFNGLPVKADVEIKQEKVVMTTFSVSATVPDDFNKDIEMNFLNQDNGLNTYVILTKSDNYKYNSNIPIGNSKLQFVNIIQADKKYNYSCNASVTGYENQECKFNLLIEDNSQNIKGNHEDEYNEKYKDTEKVQIEEDKDKNIEPKVKEKSIFNRINSFMKKYVMSLGIILLLGAICLIKKIKGRNK